MDEIGTQNPLHAARHQAGHAVIGSVRGFTLEAMRLREENGRWLGDCRFAPKTVSTRMAFSVGAGRDSIDTTALENGIAIPLAGVLAQSRTMAEEEEGETLRFVTEANLGGLLRILLEENRTGQDVKAETCELSFTVTDSGAVVPFTIDGAWISGVDIRAVRRAAKELMWCAKQKTTEVVRDVMQKLNEAETWQAAVCLAGRLIQEPRVGTPPTQVLDGQALSDAIRELGLAADKRG